MKFVEIERAANANAMDVDATFRISAKKGVGTLRFTKKGVQAFRVIFKKLDLSKPCKIFIDKEGLSLAFRQDEKGEFKFTHTKSEIYASYVALKHNIGKNIRYKLETSQDYSFILVALKDD